MLVQDEVVDDGCYHPDGPRSICSSGETGPTTAQWNQCGVLPLYECRARSLNP